MARFRSGSPFELEGFWGPPGDGPRELAGQPQHGTLKYHPDRGAQLAVAAWQDMYEREANPGQDSHPVLFGQAVEGGRLCTVEEPLRVNHSSHFPSGHSRTVWHASRVYVGGLVHEPTDLEVTSVEVSWTHLLSWIGRGFLREGGQQELTAQIEGVAQLTVGIADERNEQIDSSVQLRSETARPAIRIEPAEGGAPLAEFEEQVLGPLRDLVLFGVHRPIATESMTLTTLSSANGDGEQLDLILEDSARPLPESRVESPCLMPLSGWVDADELLERWFKLYAELGPAAGVFFGTIGRRPYHLENLFLNLAIFAEAYHRTVHDRPEIAPEIHDAAVAEMLAALEDEGLREHYGPRLRHANGPGYRRRLKDLFGRAASALSAVDDWRKTGLPDTIYSQRNAIAHEGATSGESIDLFYVAARLRIVLEANLLLDLGLDERDVRDCVNLAYSKSPWYREG